MNNQVTTAARSFLMAHAAEAASLQVFQETLRTFDVQTRFVDNDTRLHVKVLSTAKGLPYRSLHFTMWEMTLASPNAAPVLGECVYKGVDALVKTVPLTRLSYEGAQFYRCEEGPMMVVYHDPKDGQLRVATGGNHDGEGKAWLSTLDFKELFVSCAGYLGVDLTALDKEVAYTFIVIHPDNRCVAPVEQHRLILVGTCRMRGEGPVPPVLNAEVQTPMTEAFATRDALLTAARALPWQVPGLLVQTTVVSTGEAVRVYVSNPAYNKVHKLKGNSRNMHWQLYYIIKTEQQEEFLQYFPEYASIEVEMQYRIKQLASVLFKLYFRKRDAPEDARSHVEELLAHLDGVDKGLKKKGKRMKFGTVWWKVKQYRPGFIMPFLMNNEVVPPMGQ